MREVTVVNCVADADGGDGRHPLGVAAAAHRGGPDPAVGERAQPLLVRRGRGVQPVPVAGRLHGAARLRARAARAHVAERARAHHGGHAPGPRRRQALLETILQELLTAGPFSTITHTCYQCRL